MIARMGIVVLDCPDPRALADFYAEVTGWQVQVTESGREWVELGDGGQVELGFQRVEEYHPPRWPDPAYPQQFHLDLYVDDLDAAEERVLALGATWLGYPDQPSGFRVYADPAGHPFCLTRE